MARAKEEVREASGLYERDFYLWVEEQVRLLEEGRLDELDVTNLIDEVGDLGRGQKRSIRNNLVILLVHLLKYAFQPDRRSTGWRGSIVEPRRRILEEIEDSPSLRTYPGEVVNRCYESAREQAAAETGLPQDRFPENNPFSTEEVLRPEFLPE